MKVYVVANQKGGIGKTTTATNIASILNAKGKKTLLIDADQQCNSTDTYQAKFEGVATLYDVLIDAEHIPLKDAIQKTDVGDIVASDPLLREADAKLSTDPEGAFRLLDAVEKLEGYDCVVIDTPPSLGMILRNALMSADKVIVPISADRYGAVGLAQLNETIMAIKKRQNPKLEVDGVLVVKFKANTNFGKATKENLEKMAKALNTKVYKTYIRESIKLQESQANRMTIDKYSPDSTTAIDYMAFVDELLEGDR